MAYRSIRNGVGTSSNPFVLSQASTNYSTKYFKATHTSGDIRETYDKVSYSAAGGGEVYRAVASATGTSVATGGTVNAAHFTGNVASGGTVSGALNAVRATLEVAGTTPTPGGTLAALQLDSNIVTGATLGANTAFVRVSNSGATAIPNIFNFEAASSAVVVSGGTYSTADGYLVIRVAGSTYRMPFFAAVD
jgi:hypothetical protein